MICGNGLWDIVANLCFSYTRVTIFLLGRFMTSLKERSKNKCSLLGAPRCCLVSFGVFYAANQKHKNTKAKILADTLDTATGRLLENDKSPSRKVGEIDNRGSHFYLSLYWANELANQTDDLDLASQFTPLFKELSENEPAIMKELNDVQGKAVDIGGYFLSDPELCAKIMRPSEIFNEIIKATN